MIVCLRYNVTMCFAYSVFRLREVPVNTGITRKSERETERENQAARHQVMCSIGVCVVGSLRYGFVRF